MSVETRVMFTLWCGEDWKSIRLAVLVGVVGGGMVSHCSLCGRLEWRRVFWSAVLQKLRSTRDYAQKARGNCLLY